MTTETHKPSVDEMADAFRKVLSEGAPEGEQQRAILIKRIPIICNDIIQIKGDIGWIKWLVMGLIGGVGALIIIVISKAL